jgi:BirA family biotin operon repressor/biotin-[acetyl-CoA-carboxylase] ligase
MPPRLHVVVGHGRARCRDQEATSNLRPPAVVTLSIVLGPVELVDQIDSTNAELLRRAATGAAAGAVLVADHQTAGRGRLDRSWDDEPGDALLVSVLLRPDLPPDRWFLLTFAGGLAAAEICGAELKWPNDVMVGSRKLAGLLAEASGDAVVVGMGLNLRPSAVEGAVSLKELDHAYGRDHELEHWLAAFDRRLGALDGVLGDYRAACSTIGAPVRVTLASEAFEGLAEAVTDEGHLVVDGREVTAGDVVHLRPVP